MNTREIVQKLWNLCNVLRDDGITYHQYVTELTYILFLKMAKETGAEKNLPAGYRWDRLAMKSGIALKNFYEELLRNLGGAENERVREIYQDAVSNIKSPNNLEKIIADIDALDWYSAREEGLGDLYEGLLEKNANEKKSGAGQYFTPRVLIDVIVRLTKPRAGERCNDPACGTFGFMIAAAQYVREHTDDFFDLPEDAQKFEVDEAFTGCELVRDTHRLAMMNAALHGLNGKIICGDTLSETGKQLKNFDLVLSNPPFGTKKGGERATRDDFTFSTSNKQLNFLQHIYRSLKAGGRAAVVLPDNVLFADGDGERIRVDLMNKCNLHTILRLPTGIFYAQGVKTNVLFFTRGDSDYDNTAEVWFYDLRTNMPSFGKTNPLARETFADFERAFDAEDRRTVHDERFSVYIRAEIEAKGNTLDLGLIRDDSAVDFNELPDPRDTCTKILAQLAKATALIAETLAELNAACSKKNASLPDNWRLTTLGEVAKIFTGNSINEKIKSEKYAGKTDGIVYVSTKDIGFDGKINYDTNVKIPEYEGFKIAPSNTSLLCIEGGSSGRKIGFTNQRVCFVNKLCAFITNEINSKVMYYFLQTPDFIAQFNSRKHGLIGGVTVSDLSKVQIPLPPLPEQKRIVARLDGLFAKLDAAREILQAILAGGELRRSAILHRAFTGELTESWREENGLSLSAWQECKLGEICRINPPKISSSLPDTSDVSFIPMTAVSEIHGAITKPQIRQLSEVKQGFTNFTEGDVIFAKITPCMENGKSAVVGELVNGMGFGSTEFYVIRCGGNVVNKFVYHLVRSKKFRTEAKSVMAGAVGQQRVPKSFLENYRLNLPPLSEQEEIARIVGGLLAKETAAMAVVENALAEIATLKRTILTRAFRGELGTNEPKEVAHQKSIS